MILTQDKKVKNTRKRIQISRQGSGSLRRALYFPAVSACRHNPLLKAFYERLRGRGMAAKAALVAVMRKLVMMAFAILKSRQPFDPNILCPNP